MTEAKTQKTQPASEKGKKPVAGSELSEVALNKVSGGNMPTAVEMPTAAATHGAGGGGGAGRS